MKGTSKLRSLHLSADRPLQRLRGCFLEDNAAVPPAYRVKVQKCASFVDILDVCKFTTFCDRKGYSEVVSARLARAVHLLAYRRQSAVAYKTAGSKCEILWLTPNLRTFLLKMLQAILTATAVLGLLFV